ncbi:MAG: hypothetical protein ACP5PJ_00135, partial [Acidimicrobiales bacterium]
MARTRRSVVIAGGASIAAAVLVATIVLASVGQRSSSLTSTKPLASKSVDKVSPTSDPAESTTTFVVALPSSTTVPPTTTTPAAPPTTVGSVSSTTAGVSGSGGVTTTSVPEISGLNLHGETALGQPGATPLAIWISGSNFSEATGVLFGNVAVPIYRLSASPGVAPEIEVIAPLEAVGTVDVRVMV